MSAATRVQVAALRVAGRAYGAVLQRLRGGREARNVALARRAAIAHLHRLTFDLEDELRHKARGRNHDVPETLHRMRTTIWRIKVLDPAFDVPLQAEREG